MCIVTKINHLIQDACAISANNAASEWFDPNFKILMCFFHVIKNCKEQRKGVNEKLKSEDVNDINYLGICHNEFEFKIVKYNTYEKWAAYEIWFSGF
jgi:hypothetical protein